MEEKLKAREKVENHQTHLANVVAMEEDFKHRKELDEISSELFALMLNLKFALDPKNNITPTTNLENALNEATAVSSRQHVIVFVHVLIHYVLLFQLADEIVADVQDVLIDFQNEDNESQAHLKQLEKTLDGIISK